MSIAVLLRKLRRSLWTPIIVVAIFGPILALGLSIYSDLDPGFFDAMPASVKVLMGIPEGADAAVLAYTNMLGSIAGLTVGGIAISWGSAAIAGEERNNTAGLLLSNPISRARWLTSATLALVILTVATTFLLWVAGIIAPQLLDIEIGEAHIGALIIHLTATCLFFGTLALAIGATTARAGLASGISAAVMVLSFLLDGFLQMLESTEDYVWVLPWHYFVGSEPFVKGINWRDISVLLGGVVVFIAVSYVGLLRRDLRLSAGTSPLLRRLLDHPVVHRLRALAVRGSKATGLFSKQFTNHIALGFIVGASMFLVMGVMVGAMYPALGDTVKTMTYGLSPELLAMFGGADMSTPEGFFQTETLGMMAPAAVIIVATAAASAGIAGLERRRQIGLLLANPVPRWRVVGATWSVMTVWTAITAFVSIAGVYVGDLAGDLDMDRGRIVGVGIILFCIGWMFGCVALLISAATGRPGAVVWGTTGLAVATYFANAFLSLSDEYGEWAKLSPFYWYNDRPPLLEGLEWSRAVVLLVIGLVATVLAFVAYQRRDLRLGN